jgi:hypothetical protein
MPEWKAALSFFTNPVRVRSGERAQQWFTFYSTHDAGIYQHVTNVTPGANYCLSVWGHAWSNNSDHPYTDPNDHSFLRQWIGIDPTGGTDYLSPHIVWTTPALQYDSYGLFKLPAVQAQGNAITVFFRSEPLWAYKHNDVYWDDVRLTLAEPPLPGLTIDQTAFTLTASQGQSINETVTTVVRLLNAPGLTWHATVEPDSAFIPVLTPATGPEGVTLLRMRLDSTPLEPGTYIARVRVQASDPTIAGGSQQITLRVATEPRYYLWLPSVIR